MSAVERQKGYVTTRRQRLASPSSCLTPHAWPRNTAVLSSTVTTSPVMTRPRAITLVGWLFIAAGGLGLLMDLWPLVTPRAAEHVARLKADGLADFGPAWASRGLAVVGGAWMLRGMNWARWLLVVWMLFHIGLSAMHSLTQLLLHCAIFGAIGYVLFYPPTSLFFRRGSTG